MSARDVRHIEALESFFQPDDVVIVGVLNWGLGHAARCIPIIDWLQTVCKEVILASDGEAFDLLVKEFPNLHAFRLPSYHIVYRYPNIVANILLGGFDITKAIIQEKSSASDLAKKTSATVIFSDNRLGFRHKNTRNYYLTHQVNLIHKNPIFSKVGSWLHQCFIRKFDRCFIPDYSGLQALCPAMSSISDQQYTHIGPQTRIRKLSIPKIYDILVILSGPEPQKSIFEAAILDILERLPQYKIRIIGAGQLSLKKHVPNHFEIIGTLDTKGIEHALNSSKLLISRSGYTTIMDIEKLDLLAIFIPTPGQSEQEYLAELHSKNAKYHFLNQNELNKLQNVIKSLI